MNVIFLNFGDSGSLAFSSPIFYLFLVTIRNIDLWLVANAGVSIIHNILINFNLSILQSTNI